MMVSQKYDEDVYSSSADVVYYYLTTGCATAAKVRDRRVAVRRRMNMVWMIYDGHMIPRDECNLHFLTFVLQLRENLGKNLNREIDPTGDRTRARCVRNNDVTPRPQRRSVEDKVLIYWTVSRKLRYLY